MASKKRAAYTLDFKIQVLREVDSGNLSKSEVCKKYGMAKSSLSTMLKDRTKIEASVTSATFQPCRKRMRTAKLEDVEECLLQWFKTHRAQSVPISGPILMEKANQFATELGVEFTANTGWLQRFKARKGISQKVVSGESAAVSDEVVSEWRTTVLPDLLKEYAPHDVFNADETGVFYRCLPDKTLAYKDEKVHGGKQPKDRLTVLLATNMDGTEKLPLLVIGKAKKPHCFRSVKHLPCEYTFNKKSWMTSIIFEEWVRKVDRKMVCGGRKILLLIDNCPAHPVIEGLLATRVVFLPPNTTSVLQPCDQGIIQAFKRLYRKSVLRQYLAHLDSGSSGDSMRITVLDALFTMRAAWRDVSQDTIANCWRHAGFVLNLSLNEILEESQPPTEGSDSEADNLFERLSALLSTPICAPKDYMEVDQHEKTAEEMSDREIVDIVKTKEVEGDVIEEEEDEEEAAEEIKVITTTEVRQCIQTMRSYFVMHGGEQFFDTMGEMDKFIYHLGEKGKRQTTISSFFTPVGKK